MQNHTFQSERKFKKEIDRTMKDQHSIDQLFEKFDGQWDQFEPADGHEERFEYRLKNQKKEFPWKTWISYAAAACILICLSVWIYDPMPTSANNDSYLTAESRHTDSIFNVSIKYGKAALLDKSSKVDKQQIQDALNQLHAMEQDYKKLKEELKKKGESKQLMQALITNLKMQIDFLETVNKALEAAEKSKTTQNFEHENRV